MIRHNSFFRTLCGTVIVYLLLIVSSPFASLTMVIDEEKLNTTDASVHIDPPGTTAVSQKEELPNITKIDEDGDFPTDTFKPFYDPWTINERQKLELPLKTPETKVLYGNKVACLTFDDGPDPEITIAVMNILKQYDVKATFFVIGSLAEKNPDIIRRMFNEGHAIGNHTYSHVYDELYTSPEAYITQLKHTDEILKNITGVRPRIVRSPGGIANRLSKAFWDTIQNNGYTDIGWNIVSGDASHYKANQIIATVAKQADQEYLWSHAIVLMHDGRGHAETIKALPSVISYFKDHGFEFRVVNLETPPAW